MTLWTPDLPMPELSGVDGVVVLGGVMGATDDQAAPWLPLVRQTIREAAGHGLPTLGICLGHQLAAVALGGRVQRNPHGKQRGVTPIGWTDEAHLDPLFSPAAPSRGVHSNNDVVVDLPKCAVVLARAPGGEVQAVRLAPTVWGVQWHPEVDQATFLGWMRMEPPEDPAEAAALLADVGGAREELDATWSPLAFRFAGLAAAYHRRRHP